MDQPERYLLIIFLSVLVSCLAFELRLWRNWRGRKLGRASRQILFEGLQRAAGEIRTGLEKIGQSDEQYLTRLASALKSLPVTPQQTTFAQAVHFREELRRAVSWPDHLPEEIDSAAMKVYDELGQVMQRVACMAGMQKEFEKAEATSYNLSQMIRGETGDPVMEPLVNPISRPEVLEAFDRYKDFGTNAHDMLRSARLYHRLTEASVRWVPPHRWIAGVIGAGIGWLLASWRGAIVGALVGQYSYPMLMRYGLLSYFRYLEHHSR